MTVQSMRARNLVGQTRDMRRVVVAVTWLVVAVRKDGQVAFGVRR